MAIRPKLPPPLTQSDSLPVHNAGIRRTGVECSLPAVPCETSFTTETTHGPAEKIPDEVATSSTWTRPTTRPQHNLLFRQFKGDPSPPNHGFEDTWQWSPRIRGVQGRERNAKLWPLANPLHILGGSEMMAYVLMMAPRCWSCTAN